MPNKTDDRLFLDAMESVEQIANSIKNLQYPLDQKRINKLRIELECTVELCENYLNSKREKTDEDRERYEKIEQAYDFCHKQFDLLDLHKDAADGAMHDATELTAKIVALEMIQKTRRKNEPSPLEKAFVENPSQVLRAIRENPAFQAATDNLIILSDTALDQNAKAIAAKMLQQAGIAIDEEEEQLLAQRDLDLLMSM